MINFYKWRSLRLLNLFWLVALAGSIFAQLPEKPNGRGSKRFVPFPGQITEKKAPDLSPKISRKNILYSLLVPGLGEWAAGHRTAAKIFLGADLSLIGGIIGSQAYARQLERDFHGFAAVHAGVNIAGKNSQYWIDVGNATDLFTFNERRRVQRNLKATWPETDFYFWQWDSEKNRFKYAALRSKQHNWDNASNFLVAGMIINRLISAVNVLRLIHKDKIRKEKVLRKSYFHWNFAGTKTQGKIVRLNLTFLF